MDAILIILEVLGCALAFIITCFISAVLICVGLADIKWFRNFLKGFFLILVGVLFYFLSVYFSVKIFEIFGLSDVIVSIKVL